jgi:hypothetical protein
MNYSEKVLWFFFGCTVGMFLGVLLFAFIMGLSKF